MKDVIEDLRAQLAAVTAENERLKARIDVACKIGIDCGCPDRFNGCMNCNCGRMALIKLRGEDEAG